MEEITREDDPIVHQMMLEDKNETINNYVKELQPLYEAESQLWMAIYSEFSRQKPWFDGKWWEEDRPWNSHKGADGTWCVYEYDYDLKKYVTYEGGVAE